MANLLKYLLFGSNFVIFVSIQCTYQFQIELMICPLAFMHVFNKIPFEFELEDPLLMHYYRLYTSKNKLKGLHFFLRS